ncbi:TetR/AcrR family transcriptional regulator [Luteibacter sp. 9135]|uniref:TetR/AcrR family transcriptional regulator n=1 Tax=Luteibacter sp. 9135 TaxID=1500893 RepID=UPI000567B640|nr:TetR/AcrR family transcriptional regulator [Luteibacter sp. 9135]
MVDSSSRPPRRERSLTRDRIIDAAIALLDSRGEGGLTFRALSERLATGPGALYGHIADKDDLLTAACDAIVARTLDPATDGTAHQATTPGDRIRAIALGMFDAIDRHPWVGTALGHSPGQLPGIRLLEALGTQIQALDVPPAAQWSTVLAVWSYILGVAGQNAANARYGQARGVDREAFLATIAATWTALDPAAYPFTRSMATALHAHDDRADYLAGIDLLLNGIRSRKDIIPGPGSV